MGHGDEEIGDIYSKLKEDLAFRREVIQRIGLGFKLPSNHPKKSIKLGEVSNQNCSFGPNGPKIEVGPVEEVAVNY